MGLYDGGYSNYTCIVLSMTMDYHYCSYGRGAVKQSTDPEKMEK